MLPCHISPLPPSLGLSQSNLLPMQERKRVCAIPFPLPAPGGLPSLAPRQRERLSLRAGGVKHGRDFPSSRKRLFTSQGLNHASHTQAHGMGPAKLCQPRVPTGKARGDGLRGAKEDEGVGGVPAHPGHTPLGEAAGRGGKESNKKRKLGNIPQPREKNTKHTARLAIGAKISSRGNDTSRCHGSLLKLDFSFSYSILTLC